MRAFRVDPGPFFTQIAEIPTGSTDLERANPRDLDLSADGKTLYVANTLGHTIAVIDVANDANTLIKNHAGGRSRHRRQDRRPLGDRLRAGDQHRLNEPETGHGLPTRRQRRAIRNDGTPLGYTPVMTDATKATTFDDIGSELNIFDTATNQFVYRYVDMGRDFSQLVVPGRVVDLQDHAAAPEVIRGSGPEQMFVRGNLLFVTMLHSDKVEVFRINQNADRSRAVLTQAGFDFTGGITPQGVAVSPDGKTSTSRTCRPRTSRSSASTRTGQLTRQGYLAVGVTNKTPDPTKGGNGSNLFATDEEVGPALAVHLRLRG